MKTESQLTTIPNILSEEFTIPDCNIDLSELIDQSIDFYNAMPLSRKDTRLFKYRLNELIDELNERRGIKLFNHVK